jgi:hypothetical protein
MGKRWILLGVIAVIVVAGYISGFFHSLAVGFVESRRSASEGHKGLPSCDTETGLANAKNVINGIPRLKQFGTAALGISNAKNSSITESEVDCEGVVALSNSMKGPVRYSFVKDASLGGPFLVKAKLDADHLEKF